MCWRAKVDMELLAEFTASPWPSYKHGTPDGVQHTKCQNSAPPSVWVASFTVDCACPACHLSSRSLESARQFDRYSQN